MKQKLALAFDLFPCPVSITFIGAHDVTLDNMTSPSRQSGDFGHISSPVQTIDDKEDQQQQGDTSLQPTSVLANYNICGFPSGGQGGTISLPISDEKQYRKSGLHTCNNDSHYRSSSHHTAVHGMPSLLAPPPSYSPSPISDEEELAVLHAPPLPPAPPPPYHAPYSARIHLPYLAFSHANAPANQQIWLLEQQIQDKHKDDPIVTRTRRYRKYLSSWSNVCYEGRWPFLGCCSCLLLVLVIIIVVTVVTPHRLH